ncbi:MFS general substrate transporter [Meira miltonrushii]|uniref:MFS general substrate transporter n=1 Tax=Meira miltonrushii TaxID=1280837 RepID=A0A316VQE5_9BASI|nr:MFS general substrate transporter [Meira miltonrushii]PWN37715.1 MFS general substrate transporter [Meira miltonrushii]
MLSIRSIVTKSRLNVLSLFHRHTDERTVNLNPVRLLSMLTFTDWCTFLSAYFCVMIDFFEYSTVAVESVEVAKYFKTTNTAISSGLTLSMLTRVIGAIIFGLLGDCGRKKPLIVNCLYLSIMQILTTKCTNLQGFLICRTFYGIGMGGIFGNAIQSVLDRSPIETKGLTTGLLWSAGDMAIFLTAGVKMALDKHQGDRHDWRTIFYVGAVFSALAALFRFFVTESPQFTQMKKLQEKAKDVKVRVSTFMKNFREMLKLHWGTFVYSSLFVGLLCSASHACADTYPVFLAEGKKLDDQSITKTIMIVATGGFIGSCSGAGLSQKTGRRLCVIIAILVSLCLLPGYIFPRTYQALSAGGFFFIMAGNTAMSVISIHISELSPPAFRSVMAGTSYQLGASLSSPVAVIINAIASSYTIKQRDKDGIVHDIQAYGPVIGIATAILYALVLLFTAIGPEKHSAPIDKFIPATFGTTQVDDRPVVPSDEQPSEPNGEATVA